MKNTTLMCSTDTIADLHEEPKLLIEAEFPILCISRKSWAINKLHCEEPTLISSHPSVDNRYHVGVMDPCSEIDLTLESKFLFL